jgi:hypothetical protein
VQVAEVGEGRQRKRHVGPHAGQFGPHQVRLARSRHHLPVAVVEVGAGQQNLSHGGQPGRGLHADELRRWRPGEGGGTLPGIGELREPGGLDRDRCHAATGYRQKLPA